MLVKRAVVVVEIGSRARKVGSRARKVGRRSPSVSRCFRRVPLEFLLFGFARIALGTLLREATQGASLPRPRCAFCGGSEDKISPLTRGRSRREIFSLETQTRRAHVVRSRTSTRRKGAGKAPKRVTEGEQGKYGRVALYGNTCLKGIYI